VTYQEFLASDLTLDEWIAQHAEEEVARNVAQFDADRAAARAREQEQKEAEVKAWHDAVAPVVVACGVRPFCIDAVVEKAAALFQLHDGKIVPKPGVRHPRDPCADLDPITWLADLREEDDNLLFAKMGEGK
jgi:hypothetical protein